MTIKKWALLAVLGGNLIFGFSFLFSSLALKAAVPAVVIAIRFSAAFVTLNLIVLVGRIIRRKDGSPLIAFSLKGKPVRDVILLSICQPIVYFICENYGIVYTSSSFAGIIIATAPFFGIMWDVLLLHEKLGKRSIICAALSLAGVTLTTVGSSDIHGSVIGAIFLVVAIVVGTLFAYFAKKAAPWYNPLERTYVMFGLGAAFYIVVAAVQCHGKYAEMILPAVKDSTFWISILYLAVLSSVVAFLLLNFGNSYMSIGTLNLFANFTTVISIIAGVVILKEPFSVMQVVGSVVILSSVYLSKPGE